MNKSIINTKQLFSLVVLFEFGSAVVVGLGMNAKQGSWMAILLGMSGGLVLFIIYFYLYGNNSKLSLVVYLKILLGKYIGTVVAIIYIIYFAYIAARVLRDFGELVITEALLRTPIIVINFIMICAIAYGIYLGIEVLGRAAEIFFTFIVFLLFLFFLTVFIAKIPNIHNLMPILGEGWKPVLNTAFPLTLTFPFGETIVFTTIFPHIDNQMKGVKAGLYAMIFSGLTLACITATNVSVLGVTVASDSTFPLLKTVGKVSIGKFIERLDSIAIFILIICGFFKIVIFTYGAITGLADLLKLISCNKLIIPACIAIWIASLEIAGNIVQHLKIGLVLVPKYIHIPLQIGVPILLAVITFIKKWYKSRHKQSIN
jgi:spore germination protein KB